MVTSVTEGSERLLVIFKPTSGSAVSQHKHPRNVELRDEKLIN